jgi:hypothetical protein
LLTNVYLHHVFDLWVDWWRRTQAEGDVVVTRFADDFIVGFEHEQDARRFLDELRERLAKFGLELHPDKTRLIEFGRHAARRRRARGLGKPETFGFLGFTHICAHSRSGRFWVRRITIAKRVQAKLQAVKAELRRRRHHPIPVQGRWLRNVVQGHAAYFAVPGNTKRVAAYSHQLTRLWFKALRRRSQHTRINWERMARIKIDGYRRSRRSIPFQKCASQPEPETGAQCGNPARWDLCGGPLARAVPTATQSPLGVLRQS